MDLQSSSPVILWGSGHGGFMAVIARQKYPHLVDGVWSSSGIFSHVVYLNDTSMHLESVIRNIGGEQCANQIRNAFIEIENLIDAGRGEELGEAMNLCVPFSETTVQSVASLHRGLFELFHEYINIYQ